MPKVTANYVKEPGPDPRCLRPRGKLEVIRARGKVRGLGIELTSVPVWLCTQ